MASNLSRVGKVKRATPFVEKTEKKKTKVGRAGIRMVYARRKASGYETGRMAMNPQGETK